MKKDELDISLNNARFRITSEFDGSDLVMIRWGSFEGYDGKPKIAAFRISLLEAHFAKKNGQDILSESNKTIETLEAKNGNFYQAYEWMEDRFVPVDVNLQTWFKFL